LILLRFLFLNPPTSFDSCSSVNEFALPSFPCLPHASLARYARFAYRWKDMKMRVVIGFGLAVLIIIIIVPIVKA